MKRASSLEPALHKLLDLLTPAIATAHRAWIENAPGPMRADGCVMLAGTGAAVRRVFSPHQGAAPYAVLGLPRSPFVNHLRTHFDQDLEGLVDAGTGEALAAELAHRVPADRIRVFVVGRECYGIVDLVATPKTTAPGGSA